jgi:cytochrome d ubiquinol oxidase subunit I
VKGLNAVPSQDRPTTTQVNVVHLSWDVMVGIGTLLSLLAAWYALSWVRRRDLPKSRWFLRIAAASGVLSVVALEAGWTITEEGRQPWIVHNSFKVQDAATTNHGVWATFLVVVAIYIGLGVTTILVMRMMSRRWKTGRELEDAETPYGPRPPASDEPSEVPLG